jgi:hypothetical protein
LWRNARGQFLRPPLSGTIRTYRQPRGWRRTYDQFGRTIPHVYEKIAEPGDRWVAELKHQSLDLTPHWHRTMLKPCIHYGLGRSEHEARFNASEEYQEAHGGIDRSPPLVADVI